MEKPINLKKGNLSAQVYQGQLVSLTKDNLEYSHGGGKPKSSKTADDKRGWQRSDNTMFPVIGPVYFKEYRVKVGNIIIPQDQHGIAGILPFSAQECGPDYICLIQSHDGKRQIANPRYGLGDEKRPPYLKWPFAYTLEKVIRLQTDAVLVTHTVKNESSEEMPYMLGVHPAFKVGGDLKDGIFQAESEEYSLEEVIKASKEIGALLIDGVDRIKYTNRGTGRGVEVSSKGFGNVMIWSPGKNAGMFCIEPVTQLPVLNDTQSYFFSGTFEQLGPSASATYSLTIHPFNE